MHSLEVAMAELVLSPLVSVPPIGDALQSQQLLWQRAGAHMRSHRAAGRVSANEAADTAAAASQGRRTDTRRPSRARALGSARRVCLWSREAQAVCLAASVARCHSASPVSAQS